METLEKNIAKVVINGKNVTGDITPYLSRVSYTDKEAGESDDISLGFEDTAGHWKTGWYPQQGDSLVVAIGTPHSLLNCGLFEIDEIELEFPPDTVAVKGIGVPISKSLRTKNSKAFEKQTLLQIAQYFADKHGLKLTGDTSKLQEIEIERKTQDQQTDMAFLSGLAKEYGIVFSVRGNQLVFMDSDGLEKRPAILALYPDDLSKGRFVDKTSQVYSGATVSKRNMKTNSVHRWSIKPADTEGGKGTLTNDEYQSNATAENDTQAQAKAEGELKDKNKDKITGSFTVAGNVRLVAGVNISLLGVGKFSGKWHVVSSTHTIDNSGYITDVSIRKIM